MKLRTRSSQPHRAHPAHPAHRACRTCTRTCSRTAHGAPLPHRTHPTARTPCPQLAAPACTCTRTCARTCSRTAHHCRTERTPLDPQDAPNAPKKPGAPPTELFNFHRLYQPDSIRILLQCDEQGSRRVYCNYPSPF